MIPERAIAKLMNALLDAKHRVAAASAT